MSKQNQSKTGLTALKGVGARVAEKLARLFRRVPFGTIKAVLKSEAGAGIPKNIAV